MKTTGRALLIVAVVVGSLGPVATPASAAVPGLVMIEASGGRDFHDGDEIWARCPAGKKLISNGYNLVGSGGKVTVSALWPGWPGGVDTNSWVRADETDPHPDSWEVLVGAVCAEPPPGLEILAAGSAMDSTQIKAAVAACPKGKQLIGTGFAVLSGGGQVIVEDLIPEGGDAKTAPTSVYVRAFEEGTILGEDYPHKWRVTAYAICANPLPGLVVVSASSSSSSEHTRTLMVPCPAGKVLVGNGFEVHGSIGRVVVVGVIPWLDLPGKLEIQAVEEEDFDTAWWLDGYAICADA